MASEVMFSSPPKLSGIGAEVPDWDPDPPIAIEPIENSVYCDRLLPLNQTNQDATAIINECINRVHIGGMVELPPGRDQLAGQLTIDKGFTLKTRNRTHSEAKCFHSDNLNCAELVARADALNEYGVLNVRASGFKMDHIIIDGNKEGRRGSAAAQKCSTETNIFGFNITLTGNNIEITNSVSKNALCGTGIQFGSNHNVTLWRNTIITNGLHEPGKWSDGITVSGDNIQIIENEFFDNTDIDLILFSCTNCMIHSNRIQHLGGYENSAFAGLMVGGNPESIFTGSKIYNNIIDCGPNRFCGFGLYVGHDAWGPQYTVRDGEVYNNTIRNAQQGVNIDHAIGTVIYNNTVQNSGGSRVDTTCGIKTGTAYNISPDSSVDLSQDTTPLSQYTRETWDNCIPNWNF